MKIETLQLTENGLNLEIDNTSEYKDFILGTFSIHLDTKSKTFRINDTELTQTQSLLLSAFISQLTTP